MPQEYKFIRSSGPHLDGLLVLGGDSKLTHILPQVEAVM